MAQEFTIKSENIESKINQLLPSQGGFGAGVDFSASTMVVPIVDLTETAEGSALRQDLQSALSLTAITSFSVQNATTTIINTTGYFRIFGSYASITDSGATSFGGFTITDGLTSKNIIRFKNNASATINKVEKIYDFIVFLEAGDSVNCFSDNSKVALDGCTRQIADISGNLVDA